MSYRIEELSVGGILDQAIRVARDGVGVLAPIVLCGVVPLQLVMTLAQLSMVPDLPADATPEEVFAAQSAAGPGMALVFMGASLVNLLVWPLTIGALVHASAEIYLGGSTTFGESFGRGFARLLPMLGTTILYLLAVMGGTLLLILPGIIVALWFYVYQPVVMLEPKGGAGALSRSRELMKGNLGKAFVIGFLLLLIGFGLGASAQLVPQKHVAAVAAAVISGFASILGATVVVVFYYSNLCQHEAFDVKRAAEAVGSDDPPTQPEPALGL